MLRRLLKVDRLSWKLGITITVLTCTALSGGLLLFYRHYYQHLVDSTRHFAQAETKLIRVVLEHQMLRKDRRLIRRLVEQFAQREGVQRVMILDRTGEVRYSSDPSVRKRHFSRRSETCAGCHARKAEERMRSTMLELGGGSTLRCVEPIANRKACHGCHEPEDRMNGIIIVDVPMAATQARLARDGRRFLAGTGAVALLLLGGIGLTFRSFILRRLRRFERVARDIADGNHEQRIAVRSDDPLSRVEVQFNRMADSVTGLLGELREQRASLERVMNSVDDGLIVLDNDRRVVAANDAFVRRFPGSQELIGCACCDPDGTQAGPIQCGCGGACPTLRCFETGAVQMALRQRTLADGSVRQEEVRSSPVYAAGGSISHVVEVWRDITDRRTAEAQLADYQRMVSLGMLASGFSHELNTPLASISTCLQGMRRLALTDTVLDEAERQQLQEYARIGLTQVERCGAITAQFLQLARGRQLARDILDLVSCTQTVARLCADLAERAEVSLVVDNPDDFPAVLANTSAVQQVLLNLLKNAIEASPPASTVTIDFAREPRVSVRIIDQGKGISADDLSHIFEPFFTRRSGGSGLGLFVSLNLARAWGGDIRVTSALDKGSTFVVSFGNGDDPSGTA
ncbi:MAG: PAS domain-containing protein [Deltaproteobacteria bacterium]|nr:PAS domain-containing protein [Deltaproteobacteria bacterium]